MITVQNLVKRRPQGIILDRISLEVKPGEVATIIGPSGGGKSTLLRCINGLESFEEGQISVGSNLLQSTNPEATKKETLLAIRRQVGMVFQQFNLFPHMNVLDNVLSGPIYALGKKREEVEAKGKELLHRVGLGDKLAAKPANLSGGQQQRVAIARALAVNPMAILFDEPTSALDPKMADEVLGVISDLAQSGLTMMVVTHSMGFARKVAHTVYLMSAGKVAEFGPPEQLFTDPKQEVTKDFLSRISGL